MAVRGRYLILLAVAIGILPHYASALFKSRCSDGHLLQCFSSIKALKGIELRAHITFCIDIFPAALTCYDRAWKNCAVNSEKDIAKESLDFLCSLRGIQGADEIKTKQGNIDESTGVKNCMLKLEDDIHEYGQCQAIEIYRECVIKYMAKVPLGGEAIRYKDYLNVIEKYSETGCLEGAISGSATVLPVKTIIAGVGMLLAVMLQ